MGTLLLLCPRRCLSQSAAVSLRKLKGDGYMVSRSDACYAPARKALTAVF